MIAATVELSTPPLMATATGETAPGEITSGRISLGAAATGSHAASATARSGSSCVSGFAIADLPCVHRGFAARRQRAQSFDRRRDDGGRAIDLRGGCRAAEAAQA